MATTTIKFEAPQGLTLSLELYPLTSDTASDTQSATEATNCKGLYSISVIDLATATYYARAKLADGTTVGIGVLEHTDATGTERVKIDSAATNVSTSVATDVWSAASRTLTQSAASLATISAGTTLTMQRGDTLSIALTGLGNISTRSKLWFSVKETTSDDDSEAQLVIEETDGLVYVAGAAPTASQTGSITVTNATTGAATIGVSAAASASLALISKGKWDVQMLTSAGSVQTMAYGTAIVTKDVTRAVA